MEIMQLPDYIEEVLIAIKNKTQQRRLRNDCRVLFQEYDDLLICQEQDNKNLNVTVTENVEPNKVRVYRFEIENLYYPFHPPNIYINNNSYSSMLRINGDFEKKWVKKLLISLNSCYRKTRILPAPTKILAKLI